MKVGRHFPPPKNEIKLGKKRDAYSHFRFNGNGDVESSEHR